MKYLEKWKHRKTVELWCRLAIAAGTLEPVEGMGFIERVFYRHVSRIGANLFLKAAAQELLTERRKMTEESCTHDKAGPEAMFCPQCGATLGTDPESEGQVRRIVMKILDDFELKPKNKGKGKGDGGEGGGKPGKKTLAEKLGLAGEKK